MSPSSPKMRLFKINAVSLTSSLSLEKRDSGSSQLSLATCASVTVEGNIAQLESGLAWDALFTEPESTSFTLYPIAVLNSLASFA